jgi:arachidonate 5-lipoxygenase
MEDTLLPDALFDTYRRVELKAWVVGIATLVALNSWVSKQRMSHENGITCRGSLRVVDHPEYPAHEFFVAGREFPCRVRHGAASWLDDAKLVVRSASIKFADARGESPLDMLMNTGDAPLFWNVRNFFSFMRGTMAGRGKDWLPDLRKNPQALVGGTVSVRRNPESFSGMLYNSQACFGFVGLDGIYRYARYRIQPLNYDGHEMGKPSDEDLAHPWLQNPLPTETRNRNYLKDELLTRLNVDHRPVTYAFQVQLRDRPAVGEPDWVSSAFPWDETIHPYRDVAVVTLTEALDDLEAKMTWFDLANHPASLPIPLGRSIDDPHSMNDIRLAGKWARRTRFLSYRLRGMPGPIPDSRLAPDWVAVPPMAVPPGGYVTSPP